MLLVVMMIMKQVDIAALTDDLIQLAEPMRINSFPAKIRRGVMVFQNAMFISEAVLNRLKSTNVRDCVRIARLIGSDNQVAKLDKIIETPAK